MNIDEIIQQPGQIEQSQKENVMESVHVSIPGEVMSFDNATRTAVIQPTIRRWRKRDVPALLMDVPVFFPGGLVFDVNPGDECLVVFADSCIDAWFQNGGVSNPISARMHDYSDGFALVGFFSKKKLSESYPVGRMIYFGKSTTSASTRVKVVNIPGITKLEVGLCIKVLFTGSQTYNGTPQLKLNDFDAINIVRRTNESAARYEWVTGEIISLTYSKNDNNEPVWIIENGNVATTTYYGATKLTNSATSTSTTTAMTPSALSALAKNMLSGADIYSASSPYAVGARCRHGYMIYHCIVPIGANGEEWNEDHWEAEPPLIEMIDALKSFTIEVEASSANSVIIHHDWITENHRVITKSLANTSDSFSWTITDGQIVITNQNSSGTIPAMTLEIALFAEAESPIQEDNT